MKTLEEKKAEQQERRIQKIMRTCVHFNGIQHNECKAGVNYHGLLGDKPGCFAAMPCHSEGTAECPKRVLRNREEAEARVKELEAALLNIRNGVELMVPEPQKSGFLNVITPLLASRASYKKRKSRHNRDGSLLWRSASSFHQVGWICLNIANEISSASCGVILVTHDGNSPMSLPACRTAFHSHEQYQDEPSGCQFLSSSMPMIAL